MLLFGVPPGAEVLGVAKPATWSGDRRDLRNGLWPAWLRRPLAIALRETARLPWRARGDACARAGLADALGGLSWLPRNHRVVTPPVEAALRGLEAPTAPRPRWAVTLLRRLGAARRPTAI